MTNSEKDREYRKKLREERESASLSSNSARDKEYRLRKQMESTNGLINESLSGWQDSDTMARNKTKVQSYYNDLSSYYDKFGKTMSEEQNKAYKSQLDYYGSALDTWDNASKAYSNYINKEAYDKAQKKSDLSDKYKGASYDDIQNALKSSTDQDERSFLKGYTEYSSLEDYDKAIAKEQETIDKAKSKGINLKSVYQNKLKTARTDYERTHRYDKYANIVNNDDFEEKASANMSRLKAYEQATALDPMRMIARGNVAYSDSLDEEQQKVAAYLYGESEHAYLDYMKDMTYIARKNEANEMQEEFSAQTEEHPVLSAIEYPLFNAFYGGAAGAESIASVVRDKVKTLLTGEQSDYNPTTLGLLTTATRQQTSQISQNIRDNTKTPIPQFAYDVFATEVPNRVGQMMYGKAYNVVMGMDVFATSYSDAIMNGMSPEEALWNAFVEGGLEFVTEWKGMEWAFGDEGKNAITRILKQAFAEGSEEVVSSLGYLIYDKYKNGGESEFNQNVNKYVEMGYSREEARKKASSDYIKDLAYQFAVAAFSTVPTTGVAEVTRAAGESYSGQFINREKIGEINAENLQKKYGDEWTQKASNREVYRAYSDYVGNLQEQSTKAEKEATKNAIAQEYKISNEEAEKWTEALYNGDKKALKTHFGEVLRSDLENGEGWTTKADNTEVNKISAKIRDAFRMVKSENEVSAEKASKTLKTGEKNLVKGKEAQILSMKENKDGSYTVKTSEGNVDAKDVTVTENKATALTYSANIENEALKEAYVRYYAGEDIADYDTYARYLFNAGRNGVDISENTQIIDTLGSAKAQALYNVGALEAMQEEIADDKVLQNVISKHADKFKTGTFKAGEYKDGKFKENKDFFRNLNRTQKKLYRIVEAFSKLSGVNLRVYIDRDAASENGQFIAGRNGGTIFINLAARPFGDNAYGINQYVVSTLSHELTHWLKANNREAYDILEEAVKSDLQKNNTFEKRVSTEKEILLKTHENELKESGKTDDEVKAEMEKYSKKKDLDEIALEEVVARACEDMLNDSNTMKEVLSYADQEGLTKLQAALNKWFDHIREFFHDLMSGFHAPNEVVNDLQDSYAHLKELWVKGVKEAIAENRKAQKTTKDKAVTSVKKSEMFSVKLTPDGIEEYILSAKTKNMTFSQRIQEVRNLINSDYIGKTAKFWRNGHAYYAQFMPSGISKNLFGDSKSSPTGYKAKVSIAANGELFELAEAARYTHSLAEKTGKKGKAHKNSERWDYFVKSIKFEGAYYNVLINVQKVKGDRYVYSIVMKKAPTLHKQLSSSNSKVGASDKIVTYDGYVVNKPITRKSTKLSSMDSEGNKLSEGQQIFFEDSKAVDDQGRLLVMYHGTDSYEDFTVFKAGKEGYLGKGIYFTEKEYIAKRYAEQNGYNGRVYKVYLDIKNPLIVTSDNPALEILGEKVAKKRAAKNSFSTKWLTPADIKKLQDKGYDGIIWKYGKSPVEISVWDSNQIKLTSNLNPTKDKDIRKSTKMDSEGRTLTSGQQTYFKDSEVVDDLGRLKVMYHGSESAGFTEFEESEYGIFFTDNEKVAKKYSKGKKSDYEVYLNITNALKVDCWEHKWDELPLETDIDDWFESGMEAREGEITTIDYAQYAKEHGYDGVIFYNIIDNPNRSMDISSMVAVVFNSNQVKSVTNENPTENTDIFKSLKLPAEAQKLVDELTLENKRLTEENTALKAEKGIEQAKAEKKAIIDKITEQSQVLSRWLLTNDKTNPVPQAIKEPLGKLLTSISFTKDDYEWRKQRGSLTKSEETLGERMAKISQLLNEIEQDKVNDADAYDLSQLDWIPEFTNEFAKIKDTVASVEARQGEEFRLNKMSTEDLQSLLNMITALKSAITNMNRCLSAHNKMSVSGVGKAIIGYLDSIGQKEFDNRVLQFLEIDNTVPFYFFKRLGSGGQQAFKLLMDGMNQYAFEAKQIEDYAKETFSGKDVLAWRDEVKTFEVDEVEYNAEQGKDLVSIEKRKIQMTVPQIMSLYCLSKRDQAVRHLSTGGIKIGDFKVKGEKNPIRQMTNVTLTKKDIEKITSSLTDEQIEVADKLQKFMNTVCQKWGNEITMKRFGFKGMTEKNYFPINVDRNQLSSEARQRGSSLYQLLNMGFTKPINPKAKNPIEIFDIFEVFAIHSTEMAQYNSLALPVLDVIRIWNYKDLEMLDENEDKARWHSVKASIENTIGAKGNQYIGLLLADLNGDVSGGRADDFAGKLMKNYKTAAVAANLQVAALQPLSYIRAGYMIDSKYLTKGMAMKSTDDALKYCGIAVWKEMGFYNTSIHRGLEHKIMQDESKKEGLIEKGLYLAGKADEWTWSKLWNACLLETQDKYPDLKDKELYEKTAERLTEVIYGTQVVDSILTRSQLMRDKTMYSKMVTAFQAEPTLGLNVLMDAAESFSMEKRANGTQAALQKYGKTMYRAAMVYLIGSAVESALRTVFGKIRNYDGDDDDESLIEDFLKRFIEELNPLRKIPIVKDIIGVLVDSIKVIFGKQYKLYTDTRMDEAIFENIGKSVIRIGKLIQGKEVNFKALYEIAKGIDASGIPVSSTFRTFKVAWNNTIGRIWKTLALK